MSAILRKLFRAADRHAEDSCEPDHAVGDLQDLLRAAWKLMNARQREALTKSQPVEDLIEVEAMTPFKPAHVHRELYKDLSPDNAAAPAPGEPDQPVLHGNLVRINVPSWFADPRFAAWLNSGTPKMTWHEGGKPGEGSDVVVMIDPSLTGEGTDSDMPFHDALVEMIRGEGLARSRDGLHIAVWLTNIDG